MKKIYTLVICIFWVGLQLLKAQVVINEVYGAGGNAGAIYQNDFAELYNRSGTDVVMTSWSIQYTSSTGNSWGNNKVIFSGTIPANGFYLIKLATGGTTGTPLPAEDASGAINLSGTAGKLILCNSATSLSANTNPNESTDTNIVDKLGYGAANGFEGTGPAPAASATTSIQRTSPGIDTDNNSADFIAGAPDPTNSSPSSDVTPPIYTSLKPSNNASDVFLTSTFSILFSERVKKGTGNIYIKKLSDSTTIQAIDVSSLTVSLSAFTATFTVSTLLRSTNYYIEIENGTFKDIANNNFTGISGDTTWKFTTTDALYAYEFSTCTGLLPNDGFTHFNAQGAQVWACTSFGRDANNLPLGSAANGLQINGYDNTLASNVPNEDWLISPSFDLTATNFPLLSFWSRTRFNGLPLQLKISTDYPGTGDPRNYTWSELNGRFPGQTSDRWTLSSNINLSLYKQANVHVAFVYLSSDEEGARWTLDDIRIDNAVTAPPSTISLSTADIQFGYTASDSTVDKVFNITGNDITDDITLTATAGFLLSKDGTLFSPSVTYTVAEANNVTAGVYARFNPSINDKDFTGTVTVMTSGLTSIINLKGSSIDIAKTLEVVNWNIEWFGSKSLGPINESQQEQNVKTILQNINADVYGLLEVVDTASLGRIVRQMPGYQYISSNYGSHTNPFAANPIALGEAQKVAFVYKTSVISNIDTAALLSQGINTAGDITNPSYNNWASGRFPYMLSADVTLNSITKNVKFVLLHAKANTSPTITSYNRRKAGADELHNLLNTTYASDNVVILGDFNDDLDQTITDGINPPVTSYQSFINDSLNYFPVTLSLSNAGKASTVSYSDVIDHVVVSNEMKQFYMNNSVSILNDVSTLVSGYATTTTDHYPVFSRFAFDPVLLPVSLTSFEGSRQDKHILLKWITEKEMNSKEFVVEKSRNGKDFTSLGAVAAAGNSNAALQYSFVDEHPVDGKNFYRLKNVDRDGKFGYSQVVTVYYISPFQIVVQPNPVRTFIDILYQGSINQTATIQFMNLSGKIIQQQTEKLHAGGRLKVDISNLPKGMYILNIVYGNHQKTEKIIVN